MDARETVKLRDVATGKVRATLKGTQVVRSVTFSRDGRILASAGGSTNNAPGELKVRDIATFKYRELARRKGCT